MQPLDLTRSTHPSSSIVTNSGALAASSVKIAERSGLLLLELVPAIRKTAELVQEVTAASNEQAGGISQMNKAMAQVDTVTQRNASASEELSSTAEELSAQAEALRQLVEFFKVEGAAAPVLPGSGAWRPSAPRAVAAVAGLASPPAADGDFKPY